MEEKYELFHTVLRELQEAGVLENLMLAGSWCQYYYRILFDMAPEVPLVRTSDIDFVVPGRISGKKVDVTQLLSRIGFDTDFDYHTGLVKYVHPDLEIQFLIPMTGRGKNTPYEIRELNINAEGLRYLSLLRDFSFHMSQKRKNKAKAEKDLMSAKSIGELCLEYEVRRNRLKIIYDTLPKKWRRTVMNVLAELSPVMHSFFKRVVESTTH
ncbi:MAG: hypothetical protein GY749_26955 [Desulfobacteraceae bacterium]|nr:hypothetical protein [Desulfobacteraceae bacterium]